MINAPAKRTESLSVRALWYIIAKTAAFIISFALPVILVRRLSQREFGLYKQVFLVITTAVSVLPLGIGMSAFYFLPREGTNKSAVVLNTVLFYVFIGGAVLALMWLDPALLGKLFNSEEIVAYSPLIGVAVLLWTLSAFLEIAAVANEETHLATIFIVAGQLIKTVLLLAAALWFGTLLSLVWAAIIQGIVQTIVLMAYLRKRFWTNGIQFRFEVLKTQLAYAIPFGAAALIVRFYTDFHNYYVSWKFGATLYAMYAVGCFDLPLIDILNYSIGSVTLPRVSNLASLGKTREIVDLIARALRKMSAIYLPVYCFFLINAKEIIKLLFTQRYIDSWPIFVINLTMVPLAIVSSAYDPVIRAYMEHRYFVLKLRSALAVLLIAALWIGTNYFGLTGAITAVVGVSAIERVAMSVKVGRILGLVRGDLVLIKDIGKLAVASVVASVATVFANFGLAGTKPLYFLACSGVVFSLVYAAAVLMFQVPTDEEKNAVKKQATTWLRFVTAKRQPDTA